MMLWAFALVVCCPLSVAINHPFLCVWIFIATNHEECTPRYRTNSKSPSQPTTKTTPSASQTASRPCLSLSFNYFLLCLSREEIFLNNALLRGHVIGKNRIGAAKNKCGWGACGVWWEYGTYLLHACLILSFIFFIHAEIAEHWKLHISRSLQNLEHCGLRMPPAATMNLVLYFIMKWCQTFLTWTSWFV